MSILILIGMMILTACLAAKYVRHFGNRNGKRCSHNRSSCDHLLRMVNRENAVRIHQFATAHTLADFARIDPVFMTLDASWGCNLGCVGCIDRDSRDGLPVVRQRQGGDPCAPRLTEVSGPFLGIDTVRSAVRFAKDRSLRCIQLMGGETLLHPHVDEVLGEAAGNAVPIEVVTNGVLICRHQESLAAALQIEGARLRASFNGWHSYGSRVGYPDKGTALRNQVLTGLRGIIDLLPEDRKGNVYVTIVTFPDVLNDLPEIVSALADVGVRRVCVIRERHPRKKTFLQTQAGIRDVLVRLVDKLQKKYPQIQMIAADNVVVEPTPQEKVYRPCPAVFLKMLIGADGWLYTCTDHRGAGYARLVHLGDYTWDVEKAWRSEERVRRALAYCPAANCRDLVCQRFEGNRVISLLRQNQVVGTFWRTNQFKRKQGVQL